MSFYGSIYYQTAKAIAKIFLQNAGKTSTNFGENNNIIDEIVIEADGREGDFSLSTGNRWLLFENDGEDGCKIYHNDPDKNNLENYILPLAKVESLNPNDDPIILSLRDDIYLSVPAIYYDKAGHVVSTGDVVYFKIPKIDIQTTVDSLQEDVDVLKSDSEIEKELNQTQEDRLSSLESAREALEEQDTAFDDSLGSIGELRAFCKDGSINVITALTNNMNSVRELTDTYLPIAAKIFDLEAEIKTLKQRLDTAGL